jgi:hypothetical protein
MKLFKKSPSLGILGFNTCHKFLGYGLAVLCKFQAYLLVNTNGDHPVLLIILIVVDCILFVLFVYRKLKFPTMSETIMTDYSSQDLKQINSLSELKMGKDHPVGIFANYVYDLDRLTRHHPAGYRIIESIKYRDFDRYIYGMYRSERETHIAVPKHSFNAL